MAEGGDEIQIKGSFLWVRDAKGKLLMKVGRSSNRLYKIELEETRNMCLTAQVEDQSWLWHKRMGHINFNTLEQMVDKKLVEGIMNVKIPS